MKADVLHKSVTGLNPQRKVRAEVLDHLATDDPAAQRSRRDLLRVHRAMGTRNIVTHGIHKLLSALPVSGQPSPSSSSSSSPPPPLRILELGAGDGQLMLRVAHALGVEFGKVEIVLLDRQDIVTQETINAFAAQGWQASTCVVDVCDWAAGASSGPRYDLLVTTLFLHHFEDAELDNLLHAMALTSSRIFACEPHRGLLARTGSRLIGLIGANVVTRHDAVLSVQAGFRNNEISMLWPQESGTWRIVEQSAGLFSHVFSATLTPDR